MPSKSDFKIGVFASGGGSNFQSIIDHSQDGSLEAVVSVLISNNSKCGAIERASKVGIPVEHLSSKTHSDPDELGRAMVEILQKAQVDLVVLAGYMKKIPDAVLKAFPNRVINIHPALLPAFGGPGHFGMNVHKAVLKAGAKVSGPTVHLVNEQYDEGAIIAQHPVSIHDLRTPEEIAARVLEAEHKLFWKVVQGFASGKVDITPEGAWFDYQG